ncbi:MAG: hypothetical protein DWB48_00350 [Nitrosomonas sp.]|nr:hypothetical protein [Nitrosomonas sp.]MDL1865268.1 hypothetical protein [Betaproteobacteria bacterium PRO5]
MVCLIACSQGTALAQSGAAITTLPLKGGYYVASDTPCNKASNATFSLLRRNGLGGSHDFCEFRQIEQTGPTAYRVTQACRELQDDIPPETSIATYTVPNDASFTAQHESGWTHSVRYCDQASMPPGWQQDDISNVPAYGSQPRLTLISLHLINNRRIL